MESVAVLMNPGKVDIPHRKTGTNTGPCATHFWGLFQYQDCHSKYRDSLLDSHEAFFIHMMRIIILKTRQKLLGLYKTEAIFWPNFADV